LKTSDIGALALFRSQENSKKNYVLKFQKAGNLKVLMSFGLCNAQARESICSLNGRPMAHHHGPAKPHALYLHFVQLDNGERIGLSIPVVDVYKFPLTHCTLQ